MKSTMRRRVTALAKCNRGNFSVLFALTLVPMIGLAGLAIDFGQMMRAKTALDASADAAALAAVTEAASIMQYQSPGFDPTATAISFGQAAGQLLFATNSGRFAASNPTYNTVVSKNNQIMTATTTYTAQSRNTFGPIFHTPVMNIAGSASSSLTLKKYINIYLLVDVSQSMGIASTTADIAALWKAISAIQNQGTDQAMGPGCMFGCHIIHSGQTSNLTNEQVAHSQNPPISLRIDVIAKAISNLIDQANTAANQPNSPSISIGLYTFEQKVHSIPPQQGSALPPPLNVATNYSTLKQYATPCFQSQPNSPCLDLGSDTTNANGEPDTYTQSALDTFATNIPSSGDGSSPNTPQNYVFIMTDGTYDVPNSSCWAGEYCVGPYDPSYTSALRSKATVGIIYTTYLPLYKNNDPSQGYYDSYQGLILPIAAQIGPALQSSATSSNWFLEASDGPAINAALANFLNQAASAGHLTQ